MLPAYHVMATSWGAAQQRGAHPGAGTFAYLTRHRPRTYAGCVRKLFACLLTQHMEYERCCVDPFTWL